MDEDERDEQQEPESEPGTAEILAALNDLKSELKELRQSQETAQRWDEYLRAVGADPGSIELSLAASAVAAVLLSEASSSGLRSLAVPAAVAFGLSAASALLLSAKHVLSKARHASHLGYGGPRLALYITPYAVMYCALLGLFFAVGEWLIVETADVFPFTVGVPRSVREVSLCIFVIWSLIVTMVPGFWIAISAHRESRQE